MTTDPVLSYKVALLEKRADDQEKEMERLGEKIDRLIMAVVISALTVAGSVLVFALTLLSTHGKP